MNKAEINGKVHLKGYTLLVITVPHDHKPDLLIFEELFDTIENYGIENGLKYVEIVNRKRVSADKYNTGGTKLYTYDTNASQYTVLLEKTEFK
jgi:hypothetical protein